MRNVSMLVIMVLISSIIATGFMVFNAMEKQLENRIAVLQNIK